MNIRDEFIEKLSKDPNRKIVYIHTEHPSVPDYGCELEALDLPREIIEGLKRRGITRLYKFQEEAYRKILEGKSVVITAATGAGKTEAFLLPILSYIWKQGIYDRVASLVMYPTKALARDQMKRIWEITSGLLNFRALIYDGDVPSEERRKILQYPPPILVTNPDMVHLSLQYSHAFQEAVSTAKFIVLDDMHMYSGVFGTHVHYVLRRLKRVLREQPVFIGTSATIGNPREFGRVLFGVDDIDVISVKGGRRGTLHHILVKPVGRPKLVEAIELVRECIKREKKCIVFADSHRVVEVLKRLGEKIGVEIAVHRAGLRPEERKKVEEAFRRGDILAVAATPTLEIGIDVGDVDAVIMVSIPPTYTRYIQRSGRCGRRGQVGYSFIILGEDPISTYYERNPQDFFLREYDPLMIEPSNEFIARTHVLAMAMDRVLNIRELTPIERKIAEKLKAEGLLKGTLYLRITKKGIEELRKRRSLRGTGENIVIRDARGKVIGTRELPIALRELHPEAIYFHGGRTYVVERLDLAKREAYVSEVQLERDLMTVALYTSEPSIEQIHYEGKLPVLEIPYRYCDLEIKEIVFGYIVKNYTTGEIVKEAYLPEDITYTFKTKGIVLYFPQWYFTEDERDNFFENAKAFHAIEHAMITAAETIVGASPTDLGGISFPTGHIVIYDSHPGGSGLTKLLTEPKRLLETIKRALKLMRECNCYDGCPRCIYSPYCGNNNKLLSKRRAIEVLTNLLAGWRPPIIKEEFAGKPIP